MMTDVVKFEFPQCPHRYGWCRECVRTIEQVAYERGFNDAREKAAGLFVGGDGTTLFTNRQIIDCIRALKPDQRTE